MIKQNNINDLDENQDEVLVLKRDYTYIVWYEDNKVSCERKASSWLNFITNKKVTNKELEKMLAEDYILVNASSERIATVDDCDVSVVRETIFLKRKNNK